MSPVANQRDYYKILGVAREAGEKDIKLAYRKLARKYHPDVNQGDAQAEEHFREINEAYAVLSDRDKRAKYDQFGDHWEQAAAAGAGGWPGGFGGRGGRVQVNFEDLQDMFGGRAGAGAGMGDVFSQIFTRGGGGAPFGGFGRAPVFEPSDVEAPLELTLEEAVSGTERTLQVSREDACTRCHGAGRVGNTLCGECRGSGSVRTPRRIHVKVPTGVREGTRIRVRGEGGSGPHGRHRDLYLVVKLMPHGTFEVKGDDLHAEVPVSVTEAVLGAEIEVPTMRGTARMVVPPGTQSNTTFRLSGQGMPAAGAAQAGDLYVKTRIVVPRDLSPEEKSLYQKLAHLRPENPRVTDGRGR